MQELPDNLTALVSHVETETEEVDRAVDAANDVEHIKAAFWLEWLGEKIVHMSEKRGTMVLRQDAL